MGLSESAAANTSASRIWHTSRRSGPCFSKSAPIPRISMISRATGDRPSGCTCPSSSTPLGKSAADCSSGLSRRIVALRQRRLRFPHSAAPRSLRGLLRDLVWQTDNGGEFKGDFPKALGDSQHVRIPPAAHTYQSDVETVHRLEEDEFFDLEDFASRVTSWPKCTPTSFTSTWRVPTRTRKIRVLADHRATRAALR